MIDFFGKEIKVGDFILYPVAKRCIGFNRIYRVESFGVGTMKVRYLNQKSPRSPELVYGIRNTLKSASRVIVIPESMLNIDTSEFNPYQNDGTIDSAI